MRKYTMVKQYGKILAAAAILILITSLTMGCGSPNVTPAHSPLPTASLISPVPTLAPSIPAMPITVNPERSAVRGQLLFGPPRSDLLIYAAPFYWNQDHTEGVFALNPDTATGYSVSAQGDFAIGDLPPGDYVFVVGTQLAKAVAVPRQDGQAEVFTTRAGEILDVGKRNVNLP
jgi:hypothetical protein